jgi:hypothetical protein
MIGSVFEQRDQLAELERRRQEIAAAQARPAPVPAAAPSLQPMAGAMPAGGTGPVLMAAKVSVPGVAKKRKSKHREGHDMARDAVATGPQDVARGAEDAAETRPKTSATAVPSSGRATACSPATRSRRASIATTSLPVMPQSLR